MDRQNGEPGLRSIGSLAKQIATSLSPMASTPAQSQAISEIIGQQSPEQRAASSTGGQLSAIGAAMSEINALVLAGDPAATDIALRASLTQYSIFSEIRPITDDPYTTCELRGYCFGRGKREARQLLEAAMTPAPQKAIAAELAKLRMLTISRNASENDLRATALAYLEALSEYPGDAVIATLRQWPHKSRFWPTLSELVDGIWSACQFRKMINDALN